jgi:hypothetical protein
MNMLFVALQCKPAYVTCALWHTCSLKHAVALTTVVWSMLHALHCIYITDGGLLCNSRHVKAAVPAG